MTKNKTSISDGTEYTKLIDSIIESDNIYRKFKNKPEYRDVLEHVTYEQGLDYLNIIKNKSSEYMNLFDEFSKNDIIGDPIKYNYEPLGEISPTTLRYIKVSSDIKNMFGDLSGMDIIEIGAGYGGQSKILMDIFDINSYTYVDLDNVLLLIKKYINEFEYNTHLFFVGMNQLYNLFDEYDLIISNYAFSECIKDIQKLYIDSILNKSKMGYMTCNFISDYTGLSSYNIVELTKLINKDISIMDENPKTHINNCVLYWK